MSFGHTRLDVRRSPHSSSSCSATPVVVFVALGLVAEWTASSMLVTPAEFSPFQPKVRRPIARHGPPPPITGDSTSAGNKGDPVPVEGSADEPPAKQVTADGANEQRHFRDQSKDPSQKEDKQAPEVFAELLNETTTERGPWPTQSAQSNKDTKEEEEQAATSSNLLTRTWRLCNVDAGADYIPCLDNVEAINKLRSTKHYEHRERHCPESPPTCLVPLPQGYRDPIRWPRSRHQV
jgi:hypothetical protein